MFRFALKPLEAIEPWGEAPKLSLSWFALTDGYYFIEVGDHKVLWYSEGGCRAQGWDFPPTPVGFELAASYQVSRLFEDIAELYSAILEPVPEDIAAILDTADSHQEWNVLIANWDWKDDTEAGLLWADQRTLDTGYLRAGPRPTFWRVGDTIRFRCDNRRKLLDGARIWSSELVEHELPVREFVEHVRLFGSSLLSQMDERTGRVEAGWCREGVRLDAAELRRDHESRVEQWRAATSRPCVPTDWNVVRRVLKSSRR